MLRKFWPALHKSHQFWPTDEEMPNRLGKAISRECHPALGMAARGDCTSLCTSLHLPHPHTPLCEHIHVHYKVRHNLGLLRFSWCSGLAQVSPTVECYTNQPPKISNLPSSKLLTTVFPVNTDNNWRWRWFVGALPPSLWFWPTQSWEMLTLSSSSSSSSKPISSCRSRCPYYKTQHLFFSDRQCSKSLWYSHNVSLYNFLPLLLKVIKKPHHFLLSETVSYIQGPFFFVVFWTKHAIPYTNFKSK